jgi:hypothetical protein
MEVEQELLTLASVFKHPSFREECEWRLISEPHSNFVKPGIQYREGKSSLVPYVEVPIVDGDEKVQLEKLIIGPTDSANLSMAAASMFLSKHALAPRHGVVNSMVPHRG